jgi:hypothetical protein
MSCVKVKCKGKACKYYEQSITVGRVLAFHQGARCGFIDRAINTMAKNKKKCPLLTKRLNDVTGE